MRCSPRSLSTRRCLTGKKIASAGRLRIARGPPSENPDGFERRAARSAGVRYPFGFIASADDDTYCARRCDDGLVVCAMTIDDYLSGPETMRRRELVWGAPGRRARSRSLDAVQ